MGQLHKEGLQYTLALQKSSSDALFKLLNINKKIHTIQQLGKNSNNRLKISWVKAHVGIQGNKDAEDFSKNAALNRRKKNPQHRKNNLTPQTNA